MEQQNELTFSVRQLAVLFGRTEQTIRRWKDQGKLQAVSDTDGTLAFTLDAVRELVRKNPRLLDKAAPQLREMLYGDASEIPPQPRNAKAAAAAKLGGLAAGTILGGPGGALTAAAVMTAASATKKARIFGLGNAPETGASGGDGSETAEDPDAPQESGNVLRTGSSPYLYQLLLVREQEVLSAIEELTAELEQIRKEKAAMEADGEG